MYKNKKVPNWMKIFTEFDFVTPIIHTLYIHTTVFCNWEEVFKKFHIMLTYIRNNIF